MKYTMTTPCDSCPFREGTIMKLTEDRIIEIESLFGPSNGGQGGQFPCHKTVDYDHEEDEPRNESHDVHCAGALIYAEQHESPLGHQRERQE